MLEVGIVNNMPDSALESTERQFRELIAAAAGTRGVRLTFFSIPERPRAEAGRAYVDEHYQDIGTLPAVRLDGLIVTGAEPRTTVLSDEPYWPALTNLVDWAEEHTASTVWSCLAAHAAVLYRDGVGRERCAEKLSGVFECEKASAHDIVSCMPSRWRMPHSRQNTLPVDALIAAGYQMLSTSPAVGADMFLKQRKSLFFFLQGHPEYDTGALFREYQRDVGRYLAGTSEHYPEMPEGYFDDAAAAALAAFRRRALDERNNALLSEFPCGGSARLPAHSWGEAAARIYSNWLALLTPRAGR